MDPYVPRFAHGEQGGWLSLQVTLSALLTAAYWILVITVVHGYRRRST